jgi:hypothetical protein
MVTQLRNGIVEFRFCRPGARHVSLAGDFNGWNRESLPMTRCPDGWWHCQLRITPGCYHFRYLSDGEWFLDYAAFGLDYSAFGLNSVVSVEPPTAGAAALMLMRGAGTRRCAGAGKSHVPAAGLGHGKGSRRPRGGGTLLLASS